MKNITIFLLPLIFIGCGSQPVKDPTKSMLSNGKHKFDSYSMSSMFASINGNKFKVGPFTTPNQAVHSVKPGISYLHVYTTLSGKQYTGVKAADFLFVVELQSSKSYKITPTLQGKCIAISLVDDNGNVIASPYPQPWDNYDSVQRLIAVSSMEAHKERAKQCAPAS